MEPQPHLDVTALQEGVFSVGLDRMFVPIAPEDPPAKGALKLSIHPFLIRLSTQPMAILLDAGLGEFSKGGSLETMRRNLARHSLTDYEITDIVLSHLHYDHTGGLAHRENGYWELTFPKARIWANRKEYEKTLSAERFYDEEKTEFLHFLDTHADIHLIEEGEGPLPGFRSRVIGGHTEFSLAWYVTDPVTGQTFVMAGDVIGSRGAIMRKYAAKYDFDAERGMQVREELKQEAYEQGHILMLYHDWESGLVRLVDRDPRSGYVIQNVPSPTLSHHPSAPG